MEPLAQALWFLKLLSLSFDSAEKRIIMRASKKEYETVAKYCGSYAPNSSCGLKNSSCGDDTSKSCTNCRHFSSNGEYCVLDLYDKIARDHNIE